MDYLDRLYSQYQEFFDKLDVLMHGQEIPMDWHLDLLEPDADEMEMINRNADDFLQDMENE